MRIATVVGLVAAGLVTLSDLASAASDSDVASLVQVCPESTTPSCIAQHFDAIYSLAQSGNKLAASVLHGTLAGCEIAEDARGAAINGEVKSFTVEPDSTRRSNSETETKADTAHVRQVMTEIATRCKSFSVSQIAKQMDIRWIAAAQGNDEALNELRLRLTSDSAANPGREDTAVDSKKLLGILNSFANSQHPDILETLSRVYAEGVLVPRDYAHAYTLVVAAIAAVKEQNSVAEFEFQQMDELSSHLTASEKKRAQELAVALSSNRN